MPPTTEPDPVSVEVERFVAGGDGLARHPDGRVMFVRGGIPGDRVEIEVIDERRDWMRVQPMKFENASPDRVEASCPHRLNGCGGCDWAEVATDTQLAHKAAIVADALRRTARIDRVPTLGRSVDRTRYRTSIRVVGDSEGRPAYRRAASNDLVPIDSCEIAVDRLSSVVAGLNVTPGLEVSLRVSEQTGALSARWDSRSGAVEGLPNDALIGQNGVIIERVAGVDLAVSAGSFFQSGPQAAGILVASVAAHAPEIGSGSHVVDAYGGVGLFAATVGSVADHVTIVESSRFAVSDAERNLSGRGQAATIVRSDVGDWRLEADARPVDVVIADPARTGLGRPGVGALTRATPAVLVLVSCDPVAMARDAGLLASAGYVLEAAEVHDLFPGTHHVEVVSRFVRTGTLST
jgi:23S rRNA (uracil1939-C5)-methyltransferase